MSNQNKKQIIKGKVVCKHALNFRSKPNINADKLPESPILKGEVVDIISKRGAWYRINYSGKYGYVMAEFIELLEQEDK